ncbi:MAG: hypothetical protein R3F11_23470 [Verrucomicrobiales bacterium]
MIRPLAAWGVALVLTVPPSPGQVSQPVEIGGVAGNLATPANTANWPANLQSFELPPNWWNYVWIYPGQVPVASPSNPVRVIEVGEFEVYYLSNFYTTFGDNVFALAPLASRSRA